MVSVVTGEGVEIAVGVLVSFIRVFFLVVRVGISCSLFFLFLVGRFVFLGWIVVLCRKSGVLFIRVCRSFLFLGSSSLNSILVFK